MNNQTDFHPASLEDISAINALIDRVFDEFIAADFEPEGSATFKSYISAEAITQRFRESCPIAVVASVEGRVAGYIELRGLNHISLLFVDKAYQGQGLAARLWSMAMARAIAQEPDLAEFTVNASPFGVPVYQKLGFSVYEQEQLKDGFRFVPMRIQL